MKFDLSTAPAVPRAETGALGTTITCPCGHEEVVREDGTYHVIPWPCAIADPATSSVTVVERPRFVCDVCWQALPDE